MKIEVDSVSKRYGRVAAVDGVRLELPSGELVALLGPSGCGKTTLLRLIAGLEIPDAGRVLFDGQDATAIDVRDRRVGFVFQHHALFRHLTVFENVAFGLRVRPRSARPDEQRIEARVRELLALVQLEDEAGRHPAGLSGGQRQRVALARALAVDPGVLLLDEPFGSLDAQVRRELRRWLRRLHDEIRVTSLFVTHDQEEALEVADRVVIMNEGRIEQVGTPEQVFDSPATRFVMGFLGPVNAFAGHVRAGRALLGPLDLEYPAHVGGAAAPAVGYVRPHEIELVREATGGGLWATVCHVNCTGAVARVELADDAGTLLQVELARDRVRVLGPRPGEKLYLLPREVRIFVDPAADPVGPGDRLSSPPGRCSP